MLLKQDNILAGLFVESADHSLQCQMIQVAQCLVHQKSKVKDLCLSQNRDQLAFVLLGSSLACVLLNVIIIVQGICRSVFGTKVAQLVGFVNDILLLVLLCVLIVVPMTPLLGEWDHFYASHIASLLTCCSFLFDMFLKVIEAATVWKLINLSSRSAHQTAKSARRPLLLSWLLSLVAALLTAEVPEVKSKIRISSNFPEHIFMAVSMTLPVTAFHLFSSCFVVVCIIIYTLIRINTITILHENIDSVKLLCSNQSAENKKKLIRKIIADTVLKDACLLFILLCSVGFIVSQACVLSILMIECQVLRCLVSAVMFVVFDEQLLSHFRCSVSQDQKTATKEIAAGDDKSDRK